MRYLIYFIGLSFLCISCQNGKKTNKSPMSKDTLTNGNIILKVTPNTFGRDRMSDIKIIYTVKNKASYPIQYDSRYKIEKHTGTHWKIVPFIDNLTFEDIMYSLKPDKSQDFIMPIPKILKNKSVEIGLYRIVKEVWPVNRENNKISLTTEFTIE